MWNPIGRRTSLVGLCFAFLFSGAASAAPIETGTVTFENLDTPPFYFKATVAFEIFSPGDVDSPLFSATEFTYLYVLTNLLAAPPVGQLSIPLDRLDIGLGSSALVTSATSIDDPSGVNPSSITTSATKVTYAFSSPTVDPGGASSDRLVIQSASGPGDVNATVGLSAFVDDQVLRGPAALPVASFSCFDVNKVKIKLHTNRVNRDKLKIEKGVIDLGPGETFNPATDIVKLELNGGLLVQTIPAGSFEQKGTKPKFKFKTGSGVTPRVHVHLNLDKGEWEFKIDKTDLTVFSGATSLDVLLMIGDAKGQVTVPLTEKIQPKEVKYEFKRKPRTECVVESEVSKGKRSCLSFIEVTYKEGTPDQEILQKFSDEIGHPETSFVASNGASATFHTSCSRCLVCGESDLTGSFGVTGLSDATGRLALKCAVADASCGTTPPPPPPVP